MQISRKIIQMNRTGIVEIRSIDVRFMYGEHDKMNSLLSRLHLIAKIEIKVNYACILILFNVEY